MSLNNETKEFIATYYRNKLVDGSLRIPKSYSSTFGGAKAELEFLTLQEIREKEIGLPPNTEQIKQAIKLDLLSGVKENTSVFSGYFQNISAAGSDVAAEEIALLAISKYENIVEKISDLNPKASSIPIGSEEQRTNVLGTTEVKKLTSDSDKDLFGNAVDASDRALSNRLNEQAALIISMEELLGKIPLKKINDDKSISIRTRKFKNFAPVRFDEKIADDKGSTGHFFITNFLTKTDSMKSFFRDLPPQVMSLLIPSIKLYKTIYEVVEDVTQLNKAKSFDWRIPFDDVPVAYQNATSELIKPVNQIEKILSGDGNLRTVGIKSFNYEYRGTNPAEINTNIHASLNIFFQSPADLLEPITITENDPRFRKKPDGVNLKDVNFSYVDLINQQARTTIENGIQTVNNKYYRLKIECGYADINKNILTDVLQSAGKTLDEVEQIYRAIQSTKVILFLSPYRYDLAFQDDGSVELKIDFNASVDVMLSSDSADIFKLTNESKALDEKIKIFEDFLNLKELATDATEQQESVKCFDKNSYLKALEKLKNYGSANNKPDLANAKTEDLLKEMSMLRKQAYNGLFSIFLGKNSIHSGESEEFIEPKIYNTTFNPSFLGATTDDDKEKVKARAEALARGGNLIKKVEIISASNEELIPPPEPNEDPKASQADAAAKTNAQKEIKRIDAEIKQGIYNVKFVFLGDILDIALNILNDITPIEDSPKIVLGTIPIVIPSFDGTDPETAIKTNAFLSGREINPNLADIPISLNLFREFLLENIVKQQKTRYPVIQFIKDIISQLIYPAIQPKVFGNPSAINSSVRFSTSYLSFSTDTSSDDPISGLPLQKRNYLPQIDGERLSKLKDFKNKIFNISNGPILNYVFLTCSSRFPKYLAGNFENEAAREDNDLKNGVLNFRMGTDTGIVKKIAFERLNVPYQREMLMRQEGKTTTTPIKQFYNANVEMFGNNIFRPGDYIYIHPNYMYNKKVIDLTDKLGLGGYYLVLDVSTNISEGSYDTKLRCVFQASVFNNKVQDATSPCGDKPKQ